jgi:aminoglycoside phosphotransferase (APT) family kinase protein
MLPADALAPFRVRPEEVQRLRDKGAAHAHFRLGASGLLLRVPRLSQWSLAPLENLEYQAACFRRAEPSGATPRLAAVLPPAPGLPSGALAIEEIVGSPPQLPDDMAAIAAALAAVHRVPVPPRGQRAPLRDHAPDPIAATAAMVVAQRPALASSSLSSETRALLAGELDWAADLAPGASPVTLVGTDTHPGNFIIRPDGRAVLVDLEKALYGSPAIDLAHASLPTSTLWDMDIATELSAAETAAFYEAYAAAGGVPMDKGLVRPARRLTALRTLMWCVRWSGGALGTPELDPVLAAHLESRVKLLLDSRFVLDLFGSLTHG